MNENNLFHNRYFLERLIGRGQFSEVWLAKDTETELEVALKIYAPATGLDDQGLNVLSREFAIVINANHENLLKPLYYATSDDRKPYLVLPFCKNGSILKDVGKFTEEQAWHLLRDVASGLDYLHAMEPMIIHQDIKPDNIMLSNDDKTYMITDFGISTHARSTLRKSMSTAFSSAGTWAYMAPERFSGTVEPIKASDIYSLGITVYEMLTGFVPFGEQGGLFQKSGAELPSLSGFYSEDLKKVLSLCLQLNPEDRPTAAQLANMAQTFIDGGDPFPKPLPFWKKHKISLIIVASLFTILSAVSLFVIFYEPPTPELKGIAKAAHLMKDSKTANEGLKLLTDLSNKNDADATYLLSRIYFKSKEDRDYIPDSVRIMQNALNINVDYRKAHELLQKVIKLAPENYYALYELGSDYMGGDSRTDAVSRDIQKADDYFSKALQYAKEKKDAEYVKRIETKMDIYKEFLKK